MKKLGRVKRAFVCLGAVAAMLTLTGCSDSIKDRASILSDNLTEVANVQLVESGADYSINKYEIIGADVDKTSFDFDVYFNGVASYSNNTVGFTSINYEVPSSYFENVKKTSSVSSVYDVFDKIVNELKPVEVQISPVSDISNINDAFIKNEPSPFEKYHIADGLLYNLGTPKFDDNKNEVSFDTKTLVELKSIKVRPGFGLGIGFNGKIGLGFGIFITPKAGTFTLTDNYNFVVDEATYEAMKNDISLVYDYCAEAIYNNDNTKINAERISTTSVTYDVADLLKVTGISELESNLSK